MWPRERVVSGAEAPEAGVVKSRVVKPLKAKHGWHGGGQPDAAAVAEINGLAIDTTRLRAAAGAAAFMYAFAGFTLAQTYLTALEKKIKADDMEVDDDGNVTTTYVPIGDDNSPGTPSAKVQTYNADIGNVLSFASKVDSHAAHKLNTSHAAPVTTLTNRPGLLGQARADNVDAARDAQQAVGLLKGLGEDAKDLPDLGDLQISLPKYHVELPPDASPLAELGARMIQYGLEGAVGGAMLGLALTLATEGGSDVAGGAVAGAGALVIASGVLMILGAGISLSQVRISQASGGGVSRGGGPSKSLEDLVQEARQTERQAAPSEPVGKLSKPSDKYWADKGIDPHAVKDFENFQPLKHYDLYKDKAGNVWIMRKGGQGEPYWAGTVDSLGNG